MKKSPPRPLWKKTALYIIKGYLFAVLTILLLQRHIMYFPTQDWLMDPSQSGIETVHYKTADGLALTSWYVPAQKDKPTFLMFHGNAGNISFRAYKLAFFTHQGYGFMLAEYRGYGGNPGSPGEEGFYADGRAALQWLREKQNLKDENIILYGESIGNGTAVQLATETPKIKALVLEAPFTSMTNEAGDVYPWLAPFKYFTIDKFDNISKAPGLAMPVLIVSGDHDRVIPHRHSLELFAATGSAKKYLVTLQGGDHSNLADVGLFTAISKFLSQI